MVAALRADPETADWVREKGDTASGRELRRLWDKAGKDDTDKLKPSEDDLALKFTATHGDRLRFVAEWGRWLLWNGANWKFEETYLAFDLARRVAREVATAKQDRALAKANVVAAIERLARADRQHAAEAMQWDGDLWTFNQPEGKQ